MRALVIVAFSLLAVQSIANPLPTVEITVDGGLYLTSGESWGGIVEAVNGCMLTKFNVGANLTWREAEQRFRSENLRNELPTGTSTLRSGQDRLDVFNNRSILIGEMKVVTFVSGGREVQVQYELPVLAQQNLTWIFRRPDNSVVLGQGLPAYHVSFNLKATAHIAVPLGMNGGGTMEFITTPDPWDLYASCPEARDQSRRTVVIPPITPPVTTVVHFDTTSPKDGKILISKADWDVGYPSALQLTSSTAGHAEIRIAGTRRDAVTLQPRPGNVYLRVADPPDAASYRGADAQDGDNDGAIATINGSISTAIQTDEQGKFEATLVATSQVAGDNYQVIGSADPTFNCGNICRRTSVFTLWKRVYVEQQQMFRQGTFLDNLAEAGTNEIPIEDPAPFQALTSGDVLQLVHADSGLGEGFYFDFVIFESLQRQPNGRWFIATAPTSPIPRDYGAPDNIPASPFLRVMRDGVGVVSSGTYDTEAKAAGDLFESMFIELKPTSAVVTEVPHVTEITPSLNSFYAGHWLQRGIRTSAWSSRPDPNVFHRIASTQAPLVQRPGQCSGAQLGVTSVGGNGNYSYILSKRIEEVTAGLPDPIVGCPPVGGEYLNASASRVNDEITAHETAHFWVRTARQPDMDAEGHCSRSRYTDTTNCLMHTPYAGPELYDGQVLLHYDMHGAHSEYMWIRRDPDPVPLQ